MAREQGALKVVGVGLAGLPVEQEPEPIPIAARHQVGAAGGDAGSDEGNMKASRARTCCDCVLGTRCSGHRLFECGNKGPNR